MANELPQGFFQELFDKATIGLEVCRLEDATRLYVNKAYADIFGRSIAETLKRTYWEDTPQPFTDQEKDQLDNLQTKREYGPYEKEYIRADGSKVPVRLMGTLVSIDDKEYIWSSVDVISSTPPFQPLLANSPIGFALSDSKGVLWQVNDALAHALGRSCKELTGRCLFDLASEHTAAELKQAVNTNLHGPYEIELLHSAGYAVPFRGWSMSINRRGETFVWSVLEDLTPQQYRKLFEEANVGLALCDMEGALVMVNQSFADIVGYTVDELKVSYWQLTPKRYESNEHEQLNKISKTGAYGPYGKHYIHKDGREVPVILSGRRILLNGREYIWSWVFQGEDGGQIPPQGLEGPIRA